MKIAAVTRDGKIAPTIAESTEILIVTEENGLPISKEVIEVGEDEITSMLFKLAMQNIDVLLADEIGTALQSTLRMLGVQMLPGCEGDAVENIAGYLTNEQVGDPSKIVVPQEDENDPLGCLHDCSKCMSGCHDRRNDDTEDEIGGEKQEGE